MNACIFSFQVLKLSGDKILSSRLIIDAMGNFSPVVKQVRVIILLIAAFKHDIYHVIIGHRGFSNVSWNTCTGCHLYVLLCITVSMLTLHMNCLQVKQKGFLVYVLLCTSTDPHAYACAVLHLRFICMQHLLNKLPTKFLNGY